MTLSSGFKTSHPNKVCKLQKSLYGLKQAPRRQWFAKLSSELLEYGFTRSYADYSLFTYNTEGKFMALLVYVDDLVLTSNDPDTCLAFEAYLHCCFRIKDLGPLKYFLGSKQPAVHKACSYLNVDTPWRSLMNVFYWGLNQQISLWSLITSLGLILVRQWMILLPTEDWWGA